MVGNMIENKIREITNLIDKWENTKITNYELQKRILEEIEINAKVKATYETIEAWRECTKGYGEKEILMKLLEIWKKWAYTRTAEN